MKTKIKGIGNYYGALHVKKEGCKFFMKVFCEIRKSDWVRIRKSLYDNLIDLNK